MEKFTVKFNSIRTIKDKLEVWGFYSVYCVPLLSVHYGKNGN